MPWRHHVYLLALKRLLYIADIKVSGLLHISHREIRLLCFRLEIAPQPFMSNHLNIDTSFGQNITQHCFLCFACDHDDVIKWKHFPRYWPFVRGIHRGPVNSPHKGQWRGALMFSLICARINGWVNNGETGDLRPNRAHYEVTVMCMIHINAHNRSVQVLWT